MNAFTPDSENDLLVLNAWEAAQVINGKKVFAAGIASSLEEVVKKANLKGDIVIAEPLGFELIISPAPEQAAQVLSIVKNPC